MGVGRLHQPVFRPDAGGTVKRDTERLILKREHVEFWRGEAEDSRIGQKNMPAVCSNAQILGKLRFLSRKLEKRNVTPSLQIEGL